MPFFAVSGVKIRADNEHDAKDKYLRMVEDTLKAVPIADSFPAPLDALNIPDHIKEGILKEGLTARCKAPFFLISETDDGEVDVANFSNKIQMEKTLAEHYSDPDGSCWRIEYVVMNGDVYNHEVKVSISYTKI